MGNASSSKKVQRAARTAGRPGARRNYGWPMAIGAVVVLGVVLLIASRGGGDNSLAPRMNDHWHEAYGVYDCSQYLANLPEQVHSGIHTHGDGLIHVEPSKPAETGKGANIATFVSGYPGLSISQTEIKLPTGQDFKDGGKCGDKPANVKIFFWASAADAKPVEVTSPTKDMLIKNFAAISFAFVPDGVTPPLPPSVSSLANPNAGEGGGAATTAPPAETSSTTAAPASSSTTATTAKP